MEHNGPAVVGISKVLVVDDERDMLELLRVILEKAGYEVITSTNGEAGFSAAVKNLCDVIMLDYMLPGLNGLEISRLLLDDNRTYRVPVIMLSARSEASLQAQALQLGVDDYIVKPFDPRELVSRIKAVQRHPRRVKQM